MMNKKKHNPPVNLISVPGLKSGFIWDENTPSNEFTPEMAVAVIQSIPDLVVMMDYQVHKADEAFQGLPGVLEWIGIQRRQYRHIARWLRYYLMRDKTVLPELTFDKVIASHKPAAELTMCRYQLALEVYPRSDFAQDKKLYPLRWMLCCEADDLRKNLENLLTGKVSGKSTIYKATVAKADTLKCQAYAFDSLAYRDNVSHVDLLEAQAVVICRNDDTLRPYWQNYLNANKRLARQLTKSPTWSAVSLGKDGNLTPPNGRPRKQK